MKIFFLKILGEFTKFVGNCVPKSSSKTGKRTLILIQAWQENLVSYLCFELALVKRSQMLDGAFKQETSNIIEDTFSAYNICRGRMILHVLWVQKNTSNEGLVFVEREFFVNRFWQLHPKPPTACQMRQYQWLINI